MGRNGLLYIFYVIFKVEFISFCPESPALNQVVISEGHILADHLLRVSFKSYCMKSRYN